MQYLKNDFQILLLKHLTIGYSPKKGVPNKAFKADSVFAFGFFIILMLLVPFRLCSSQ